MSEQMLWRRGLVLGAALLYWVGVLVKARRLRRRLGRSANLRPRGGKERMLWAGWLLVIGVWMGQPVLLGLAAMPAWLRPGPGLLQTSGLVSGLILTGAGYAGTLWCYAAMGDTWRIGVNRKEKNPLITHGPYRFVRHPIYLFQMVLLLAALVLLPSLLSVAVLVLHLVCVLAKALDEESYLRTVHGQEYLDYLASSGRLLPRWGKRRLSTR